VQLLLLFSATLMYSSCNIGQNRADAVLLDDSSVTRNERTTWQSNGENNRWIRRRSRCHDNRPAPMMKSRLSGEVIVTDRAIGND